MNSKDYVLSVRIKNDKEGPQTGDVVLNGSAVNEWLPDAEYEEGDVVVFNSQFYQAKKDIDKDMDFDPDKWNQIGVPNMYVPDFEPQTRYTKDQVVSYDGQIYKAKKDFVSKDKFYEEDWISLAGTSYEFTSEDKTVTLTINGDTVDFSILPYINQTKKEIDKKINNKVDKEEGKVLSSNDFTDEQKAKLHNLVEILSIGDNLTLSEDGRLDAGFSISFDPSLDKESTNAVQNKAIATKIEELEKTDAETKDTVASNTSEIKKNRTDIDKNTSDIESFQSTAETLTSELNNKVDKEEGKSLSSNDYTDTDQTKLNSLASIYKIGKNLSLDGNTLNADDQRITLEETTGESHSAGMTQAAITQAIQSATSKIENVLAPVATSGSYEDLSDTPEGETLTIKTNDTIAGTFTTLSGADEEIVIKVPTTAADIGALSSSESFAQSVSLTIDPLTFKVALQLYDQSERPLGEAQEIDLPLESVVVSGSYDNEKKEIILTLQDGSQVEVPVADLIAGLATTEQVDEKVAAEATRAKKAEEANAAAIEELKSKETTDSEAIEDLQDRLTTAEGNIKSNTQNIETKAQEAKDYTDEKVSAQADELKAYVDTKSSEAQTAAETFATDAVDSAKTELGGKITENSEAIQKAQEDIGTLQTSGSDLDAKIDEAVSALEEADTALGQRITEESSARTAAEKIINDNIAANSEKITANENAIKAETTAREEAVSSLDTRVTTTEISTAANKKQIDTNTKNIATNKTNIAANTADITTIKDTTVVKSVAVNGTASTDTVKVDVGSGAIGDGSETKTLPLPVASRTQAGVMNAATFTAVEEMKEGLSALANEAVAVEGVITDKSSQAEITAAWKEASGSEYGTPIPGASIFDTENKVMYRYYGNTKQWALVQDGLAAEVKIALATNTQAGIVKGSTQLGQNFVETDGSLSLNGWDSLTGDVSDLKTNSATKAELTSGLATKQNTLKAGTNVKISADNTISATDTTYKNGTGLLLTGNTFSVDNTIATNTGVDSKITNALKSYTTTADLNTALGKKQNTIKAGNNISINSDGVTINSSVPDLGVTTGKLANRAVTTEKLGAAAVKSDNIDWTTMHSFTYVPDDSYDTEVVGTKSSISYAKWGRLVLLRIYPITFNQSIDNSEHEIANYVFPKPVAHMQFLVHCISIAPSYKPIRLYLRSDTGKLIATEVKTSNIQSDNQQYIGTFMYFSQD